MSDTYNGWANYETWNVALWIGNDEGLYSMARDARLSNPGDPYQGFVDALQDFEGEIKYQTPDGVSWNDSGLDRDELNDMLGEL